MTFSVIFKIAAAENEILILNYTMLQKKLIRSESFDDFYFWGYAS